MGTNLAQKLIKMHLISGEMQPGREIAIKIDQTLTQDATGTLVMLELEAMGCKKIRTEVSCQYVDHNLLQTDFKNADDHLFLESAAQKFGLWFSRPGNGVSHPVHMERFGKPGKSLLGSDSHTPAAGSLAMLSIGAGGLEVALAMMGEPFYLSMPEIWGIELKGKLPDWVSAKDIILELLRRHDVKGGINRIIEYYGPGLKNLSAMDRHVIANMGAELGATSSVFPSDERIKDFLRLQGREEDWSELSADPGASYDHHETIDLSTLVPLIACPSSPGNVCPVSEVAGKSIYQAALGSSANPGLRDYALPALMLKGRRVHPGLSFDVNPSSRQVLNTLTEESYLSPLILSGARIHQAGCNGCIGMGQAPATGRISLRTFPRNFPGRSGTKEDSVYLCSPETATASALKGKITDPRDLAKEMPYPHYEEPSSIHIDACLFLPPSTKDAELIKGPNIKSIPHLPPLPSQIQAQVLLKVGDNLSTDEISPAGAEVLPFRSNIPMLSRFCFRNIDPNFYEKSQAHQKEGFFILAGENYGQGSSREHAALAPRFLGLRAVIAKSYARIHRKNLINFGVLPLLFSDPLDHDKLSPGDSIALEDFHSALSTGIPFQASSSSLSFFLHCPLSPREWEILQKGSLINSIKDKQ